MNARKNGQKRENQENGSFHDVKKMADAPRQKSDNAFRGERILYVYLPPVRADFKNKGD